ncbi:MAG TPA: hypothetical protein VE130_12905 [Nitrososphaeraceae archaeon]|jgi:hypothetical protein|nr:hypothetical protein [Nitrososphaeraceae archaeon]
MHYWVGSHCLVTNRGETNTKKTRPFFPLGVISATDRITMANEMANNIPDKSWMLYLLEIFNTQDIALELNLICQFDGQDYFEAIFRGINQYRFVHVIPTIGHSYNRQIFLDSKKQTIRYMLVDKNSGQSETYDITGKHLAGFDFQGSRQFTGLEWWNKVSISPYPIKYEVQISQLLFGLRDNFSDECSYTFYPYNALLPNNDGSRTSYPVSMKNLKIENDGLSYRISSGGCSTGIRYGC